MQGNDERKIATAESIHRNTTASQGCVAERLRMKSGGECKPAVRTETENGNTQREIKAGTSAKPLGQRQIQVIARLQSLDRSHNLRLVSFEFRPARER